MIGNDPYATAGRCPICGATGACPDGAPVPLPLAPFDIPGEAQPQTGALRRYRVERYGYTTHMLLTDADAAPYGAAATLEP